MDADSCSGSQPDISGKPPSALKNKARSLRGRSFAFGEYLTAF